MSRTDGNTGEIEGLADIHGDEQYEKRKGNAQSKEYVDEEAIERDDHDENDENDAHRDEYIGFSSSGRCDQLIHYSPALFRLFVNLSEQFSNNQVKFSGTNCLP